MVLAKITTYLGRVRERVQVGLVVDIDSCTTKGGVGGGSSIRFQVIEGRTEWPEGKSTECLENGLARVGKMWRDGGERGRDWSRSNLRVIPGGEMGITSNTTCRVNGTRGKYQNDGS